MVHWTRSHPQLSRHDRTVLVGRRVYAFGQHNHQTPEISLSMATFGEFYSQLDPDAGVRGKQFEHFVKWILTTDPEWSSEIDKI
jgi:hypothetical protein